MSALGRLGCTTSSLSPLVHACRSPCSIACAQRRAGCAQRVQMAYSSTPLASDADGGARLQLPVDDRTLVDCMTRRPSASGRAA
eukprot:942077-Pleurochrysis_carterae.AAC.3